MGRFGGSLEDKPPEDISGCHGWLTCVGLGLVWGLGFAGLVFLWYCTYLPREEDSVFRTFMKFLHTFATRVCIF